MASDHGRSARPWRVGLVEGRRLSRDQLRRRCPRSAAPPAAATGVDRLICGRVDGNASRGEISPAIVSAVVLVDIVPNMDQFEADRVFASMADRVEAGFESLDEVADVVGEYNPHRPDQLI